MLKICVNKWPYFPGATSYNMTAAEFSLKTLALILIAHQHNLGQWWSNRYTWFYNIGNKKETKPNKVCQDGSTHSIAQQLPRHSAVPWKATLIVALSWRRCARSYHEALEDFISLTTLRFTWAPNFRCSLGNTISCNWDTFKGHV